MFGRRGERSANAQVTFAFISNRKSGLKFACAELYACLEMSFLSCIEKPARRLTPPTQQMQDIALTH